MRLKLVIASVGLFFAFMGVVHSRNARAILGIGSCPLGYDMGQSVSEKEANRHAVRGAYQGQLPASAHPAHGFELGVTSKETIVAWASENSVTCSVPKTGPDLSCETFDGRTLWLDFTSDDRLAVAIVISQARSPEAIDSAFAQAVHAQPGPATRQTGPLSAQALQLLEQSVAEYRFSDYYAQARTSNMGGRYVLTEEYRLLQ